MYDFEKSGCPEALVETGAEIVVVGKDNLFTSDQGTNDRIISECPNALENGRKTNFTLNIDGVDYITQLEQQKLGTVSHRHVIPTDHMLVQWTNMQPEANQVLAPADGFIVEAEGLKGDFRFILELSCNEYLSLGHLDKFAGSASQLENEFGEGHRRIQTRIPVKAGDVIALTGEIMSDLWYWDQTKKIDGVREANYFTHNGMNLHAVDIFDYLKDDVSVGISKKIIGSADSFHGQIGWNENGNLQGDWYELDTFGEHGPLASWLDHIDIYSQNFFGPWDGALSFSPNAFDPKTYLISVGSFDSKGSIVGVTKNNQSPLDLKPGMQPVALELYDFTYLGDSGKTFDKDNWLGRTYSDRLQTTPTETKLGVIVLQLVDDKTLKVEKRPGESANNNPNFVGEPIIYKR